MKDTFNNDREINYNLFLNTVEKKSCNLWYEQWLWSLDYTVLILGFIITAAKDQSLSPPIYLWLLPLTLRAFGRSRSYLFHTPVFNWNTHVRRSLESSPHIQWYGNTVINIFIWARQPAVYALCIFPSTWKKKRIETLFEN